MYPYDIVFALNDKESIVVELRIPFEEVPCYCLEYIVFVHDKQKYRLALYDFDNNMKRLQKLLIDALANTLSLHKSITKDLGFLENIEIKYNRKNPNSYEDSWQGYPGLIYEKKEDCLSWIGYRYQLWAYDDLSTWIYNDKNGAIIFEVTQRYPYLFEKNKKQQKGITFKQWMRSYRPLFIHTISSEIAQEWLKKTGYMVDYMNAKFNI